MSKKDFGKKAKDKISGFEGIITGKASYMYGCDQYLISPKIGADGSHRQGVWFDEGRIEVLSGKRAIEPAEVQVEKNGAGEPAPIR